ncbi:hypothetical protein FKX85_20950 [Echinicola soli]|uniref:Uncharacterized protein n=1 Tax=Echinicola soli TaxID=2591634 RepID=A0A514CNR0_9BACT|nr:hypothetical protein [Echinicola soli]QDH81364.1 hypothetical protein FKX85_20950 [Echinicola soli]
MSKSTKSFYIRGNEQMFQDCFLSVLPGGLYHFHGGNGRSFCVQSRQENRPEGQWSGTYPIRE